MMKPYPWLINSRPRINAPLKWAPSIDAPKIQIKRLLPRLAYLYFWFPGAPLPPFAVNTTSCANFTTTLSWNVIVRQDLPAPVGFIIDMAYKLKQVSSSLPTSSYSKLAEISSGSARSYVVKMLQPYHQFYFRIRAKSQVGVGLPGLLPTHVTCVTNSASKWRQYQTRHRKMLFINQGCG